MRLLAFSLLLIVLIGFAAAVATVVFHFRKYAVPGDRTVAILRIFYAGTILFALMTIFLFLSVPWDAFSVPALFSLFP